MNKVMLIGNVGKDPDIKYYEADQAVASFSLATTERGYTLQNGTQVPDHTDWHNILMWGNLAKLVEKYVHKGDKLYIEGRIRYRSYDDQKGARRYVTEILAENMEFLTPKSHSNAGAQTDTRVGTTSSTNPTASSSSRFGSSTNVASDSQQENSNMNDVPF